MWCHSLGVWINKDKAAKFIVSLASPPTTPKSCSPEKQAAESAVDLFDKMLTKVYLKEMRFTPSAKYNKL